MVFKFRLISHEQDDFVRDFEILANQTFFNLHIALQDNLGFDKSQIASFFICNQEWDKEQEITLFELSEEEGPSVITMDNAILGDHMKEIHDKMIYVFDVFNERSLYIELVKKQAQDAGKEYPFCSLVHGAAPQQILMDQLFSTNPLADAALLDDTVFGEELLDPDDIDGLGYDTMIFDDSFPDEE